MRRLRLILLGALAFIVALNVNIPRTVSALFLCGLLGYNSLSCDGIFAQHNYRKTAVAALSSNTHETSADETNIAIPPIIRPASAGLPNAIADDFIVSQQTPYDSGRNEIVATSPSTNTTQRFWVSLPGEPFQLYELGLSNVSVDNAEVLIASVDAQTTTDEVKKRLQSFSSIFENNVLSEIKLADGTKAEFSEQQVVIKQPDGRVAEVIERTQASYSSNEIVGSRSRSKSTQLAQKGSCEKETAKEILKDSTDIKAWTTAIAQGWSPDIDWQDALATRLIHEASAALAHTLQEATSDNVALQKVACKAPVQCGFRRDTRKEGISGSQVITDLFRVPEGATGEFNLDYEFFTVPDRLEISYNGEIKHAFGPVDGNGSQSFSLSDVEQGFVGIRVIGNPDKDTEWWYEINCDANPSILAIDKWWATEGSGALAVTLDIEVYAEDEYRLDVDIEDLNTWDLIRGAQFVVDGNTAKTVGIDGAANLGVLSAGTHKVKIQSFEVPDKPIVEEVKFHITKGSGFTNTVAATFDTDDYLSALFVSDRLPSERNDYKIANRTEPISGVQALINYYAPILHFMPQDPVQFAYDASAIFSSKEQRTTTVDARVRTGDSSTYIYDIAKAPLPGVEKAYASVLEKTVGKGSGTSSRRELAINYYFFYPVSNWCDFGGVNTHEGDWEGITIFFAESSGVWTPYQIAYANHVDFSDFTDGFKVARWDEANLADGRHPNVFVGLGGHASYPNVGKSEVGLSRLTATEEHRRGTVRPLLGKVEYLPRTSSLTNSSWLMYPGHWGSPSLGNYPTSTTACSNPIGDDGAPRGPVYLDATRAIRSPQSLGRSIRWLDPWGWVQ